MNITQQVLLDIQNLNTYILATIPGKIIINDQNNGLNIITNHLMPFGEISFSQDVVISHIYEKNGDTEILLYCEENKCLVYVNTKKSTHTIIPITLDLNNSPLLPLYLWDDSVCFLTTSTHIYSLDLREGRFKMVAEVTVRQDYYMFYQCWEKYRSQNILFFHQKEYVVVVRGQENIIVNFFDPRHHHHGLHPLEMPKSADVIDVHYFNEMLLMVKKNCIEIFNVKTNTHAQCTIESPYLFVLASFIDETDHKFVALCYDERTKKHTQLRLYQVA